MSHCCHIAVTLLLKWQLRSKGASFVCCFHSSAHISGGKNFPCVFLIEEEEAQKETEGVQSQKMKKGCLAASCFFLFYQKKCSWSLGSSGVSHGVWYHINRVFFGSCGLPGGASMERICPSISHGCLIRLGYGEHEDWVTASDTLCVL